MQFIWSQYKKEIREKNLLQDGSTINFAVAYKDGDLDGTVTTITYIESMVVANKYVTAKGSFILNECKKEAEDNLRYISREAYNNRKTFTSAWYNALHLDTK